MPTSCSSKPGMNWAAPIVTWMFSPAPPSNGVPSMVPLKEIVTRSPVSALAPSALAAKGRFCSAMRLMEMVDGHVAGTKAVETAFVLEVDSTCARLGIEIRCGNADLEFVLQSVGDGFLHLHGVNLLPAWSGQKGRTLSIWSARKP